MVANPSLNEHTAVDARPFHEAVGAREAPEARVEAISRETEGVPSLLRETLLHLVDTGAYRDVELDSEHPLSEAPGQLWHAYLLVGDVHDPPAADQAR